MAIFAGIGDALTQAEVAFPLIYFLPIAMASWFLSRNYAFCIDLPR